MSKLVTFNSAALMRIEAQNTKSLDDFSRPRREMATASELCGCFRKIVMKLMFPTKPTEKELRQKRRGHIFEIDQAERFAIMGFKEVKPEDFEKAQGPCFTRQLVVEHPEHPIGAHLDFTVRHKDSSLHVIESKTTDGIPWEPYGNWVDQQLIQLGLLKCRFPDAKIRGSILAADLSAGKEQEFNSFTPPTEVLMDYYIEKGLELVEAKTGKREPSTLPGILCGFCPYQNGCPEHEGAVLIPGEIMKAAEAFERLNKQKDHIEEDLDLLRNNILAFTGTSESFSAMQGGYVISTIVTGDSTMVDSKRLKSEQPDIYKSYSKPKKGSTKLSVRKVQSAAPVEEQKKAA